MASLNPEEDANYTTIDSAYESLLADREKEKYEDFFEEIKKSKDDVLCELNLETARLFKSCSEKHRQLSKELSNLIEEEEQLTKTVSKYGLAFREFLLNYVEDKRPDAEVKELKAAQHSAFDQIINIQKDIEAGLSEKKLNVERELDDVTRKLTSLREIIKSGIDDIVKPEDVGKKMCPVCFDREVDTVLVPCGHTYCNGCSVYDGHQRCPQCRAGVQRRIKMFFSI